MRKLECERVALRNLKRKRDELGREIYSQESGQITDGGDSDPEITLAEGISQSARHEESRRQTKRPRHRETFQDRTEGPDQPDPSMRRPNTPITATQKAFEVSSDTEAVTDFRLQTTSVTANSRRFCCAWLGCHDDFRTIGMLRQHVSNKHLAKVVPNRPVAYGCLWNSCAGPNISYFPSEELWEAHMDEIHYHAEMRRVLDQSQANEQQESNARSQRSLPSPLTEDGDAHGTHLELEPPDPAEDVQATPIQLSNEPSEPSPNPDSEISDDITFNDIPDPGLRKQISTTAQSLRCSFIMARTLLQAKPTWPLRQIFNSQVNALTQLSRSNSRDNHRVHYPQYAHKINRLRKVIPTANEQLCLDVLCIHDVDFRKARDEVAKREEWRLATVMDHNDIGINTRGGHQLSHHAGNDSDIDTALPNDNVDHGPTNDSTDANNETTSSLSTSAFHTPAPTPTPTSQSFSPPRSSQTRSQTTISPSRLRHRKEAYEAARGLSGREWAVYSPVSAGNNHSVLEVEL